MAGCFTVARSFPGFLFRCFWVHETVVIYCLSYLFVDLYNPGLKCVYYLQDIVSLCSILYYRRGWFATRRDSFTALTEALDVRVLRFSIIVGGIFKQDYIPIDLHESNQAPL